MSSCRSFLPYHHHLPRPSVLTIIFLSFHSSLHPLYLGMLKLLFFASLIYFVCPLYRLRGMLQNHAAYQRFPQSHLLYSICSRCSDCMLILCSLLLDWRLAFCHRPDCHRKRHLKFVSTKPLATYLLFTTIPDFAHSTISTCIVVASSLMQRYPLVTTGSWYTCLFQTYNAYGLTPSRLASRCPNLAHHLP